MSKKEKKPVKETPPEEPQDEWWTSSSKAKGGRRWETLSHNGVMFPPPYEPHGVKMLYDGKPVTLTPAQEEVATFFVQVMERDNAKTPLFQQNFFHDFQKVLGKVWIVISLFDLHFCFVAGSRDQGLQEV